MKAENVKKASYLLITKHFLTDTIQKIETLSASGSVESLPVYVDNAARWLMRNDARDFEDLTVFILGCLKERVKKIDLEVELL